MPKRTLVIEGTSEQTERFVSELAQLVDKANALPELTVRIKREGVDGDGYDLTFTNGKGRADGDDSRAAE